MPRTARLAPGGMVFHVLNRGVGRMKLFGKDGDYEAFEAIIEKTLITCPMRICAYCLLPNHWHFVLWPKHDGDLAAFMQKLTVTHVRNWQEHRRRVGYGHVYQGRYKSFPVETDDYFYRVARYVERNAMRAGLSPDAGSWRWGSMWRRVNGTASQRQLLSDWPVQRPRQWRRQVNEPLSEEELEAIRRSVNRGCPYGNDRWVNRTCKRLGLESKMRSPGRPRKEQ